MSTSSAFIVLSIVVLAVTAGLVFFLKGKKAEHKLTPLAGLAFGFILAGMLFGENRFVGYGLMGVGVILAVADMVYQLRTR